LSHQNQQALEARGSGYVDEGHQVHALVLRFFQERADPAAIVFHAPQGMQMLQGAAHHARNRRNRFQYDRTMTVSTSEKSVGEESEEPGESIGNPVGPILWSVVSLDRCCDRHA
jgi:hypothetical protein